MTRYFKFKMAPKRSPQITWIIFVFSALSSALFADGAPLLTFNGTRTALRYNEHNAHEINASVKIVFEGKNYNEFFISSDGYIMFTNEKAAVQYTATNWSGADVSPFIDVPFIAPYYFNGHHLDVTKGYTGKVYYQVMTPNTGNAQDLQNIGQNISSMMIGGKQFNPTWGISITWENVTSEVEMNSGTCSGTNANPCKVNTFQLVLLTDGSMSHAIFNYYAMNVPVQKLDQAGFNGGNGIGFFNVLGQSMGVDKLMTQQSSVVPGRYIFDISSGTVLRGGCSNDGSDYRLSVFPNYAGMFGGKVVDVSGPCFPAAPRCSFSDANSQTTFNATVISVTPTRVRCVVPRMTTRGRVVLSVSVDNGATYPYKAPFTIVFPGRMPASEHVNTESSPTNMAWFAIDPVSLTLSWSPALLSNTSHTVDISLYGYRETGGQMMYTLLKKLATGVNGFPGSYTLNPADMQCTGQMCFDYEIGLVEVRLQDGATPQTYKFLSSKVVPLGWYVRSAMVSQLGSDWSSQKCVNWYNQDMQDTTWTSHLLSCPCSLSQAIADFGRFQPDNGCNLMSSAAGNCFYHKGAVHCVRAVQPTSDGAGNQCCYNKEGALVFAADSFQGSTPDRSHDWGAAPYGSPGYVPTLSHWIDDVVSFYYCCLWTEYNSCDYYMDARPTKDCVNYVPPVIASVFGQGHVMSFGGDTIRILNRGDYVLFTSGSTSIQGRFTSNNVTRLTGTGSTTISYSFVLSAVAIQDAGTSDRVELRLRTSNLDRSVKYIDVRVNGQLITFNEGALRWQDFKGVAIANTDYSRKVQSNFTVMLSNGIGFQVAENSESLQLDLMVPSTLQTAVSGLFGTLDGNMTRLNGTAIDPSSIKPSDLFYNYEVPCAVPNETLSLFLNHIPANYTFGVKLTFNRPYLSSVSRTKAARVCVQSSPQCMFDYRTTGSLVLAGASLQAAQRFMALSNSIQPVRTCGLLNVARSTKDNYNTILGTQTTLTGCRSGALSGTTTYTCTETSNTTQAWTPDVTGTCQVALEDATTLLLVAILVPCVVVLFIAIVVGVCVYKKRTRTRRHPGGPPRVHEEYDVRYNTAHEVEKERHHQRNYERRPSNEYTV